MMLCIGPLNKSDEVGKQSMTETSMSAHSMHTVMCKAKCVY